MKEKEVLMRKDEKKKPGKNDLWEAWKRTQFAKAIKKESGNQGRSKMEKIVFSLKGKELCWVSAKESSIEEVKEIRGLLAYQNKTKEEQIEAIYKEN